MSKWTPYSEREEWADVQPIAVDEGPAPVCPIAYSERFTATMDYFRAVLHTKELSQRAFELTTDVIHLNAANYTAWHFRRQCLWAIEGDLADELEFCNEISRLHEKNYQVWYHRQQVVSKRGSVEGELEFCSEMLLSDSKNYHVWSYRQWVVKHFQLFAAELPYTESLIAKDIRNNSAWNHRFWVVQQCVVAQQHDDNDNDNAEGAGAVLTTPQQEVEFALKRIAVAPNNASPWLYLEGLLNRYKMWATLDEEQYEAMRKKYIMSVPVRSLLVHYYEQNGEREKAAGVCAELQQVDSLHEKYWIWKKEKLSAE